MDTPHSSFPRSHPALTTIVGILVVIIAVCVALVFWPRSAVAPEPSPTASGVGPGEHCGGNITNAPVCQPGYHCAAAPGSHLPVGDVGGICTADLVYRNGTYGFSIALSDDWKGYTVTTERWDGQIFDAAGDVSGSDSGPKIVLHYPGESAKTPHEAMPVMVFTIAQFNLTKAGDIGGAPFMSVSAAPFGPQELARNSKYVLALPARYNYDFAPGYEQVDVLVRTLRAFEPTQ
jgi:hypothetical protein